jgi:hypothetical protein
MSYNDCGFILMPGVDMNTSLSADGPTDQVFLAFLDSYPRDHDSCQSEQSERAVQSF